MGADPVALVSVHDVMPGTLERVEGLLDHLEAAGVGPCTLLVVPGRPWTDAGLRCLHAWVRRGHVLAAHGWRHHVDAIRGWRHRAHSLLLSRRVAEHLALDSAGILALMTRASEWFAHRDLPRPDLYVPPAWALGPLAAADRRRAPYRTIEVLSGLLDTATGALEPAPVVGFEADTLTRQIFVRLWNRLQEARARRTGWPLRIGLHPGDFELRLARDAREILRRRWRFALEAGCSPSEALQAPGPSSAPRAGSTTLQ